MRQEFLRFLRAAALGLGALAASHSHADLLTNSTTGTCTAINCSSDSLTGAIRNYAESALAWVGQIYVGQAECLRLQVTDQYYDLEMTVVAPNGLVYRNDNGGPGQLPLIKIDDAPVYGFYALFVSTANGSPGFHTFDLSYGRYNLHNPNCTPPTPPQ